MARKLEIRKIPAWVLREPKPSAVAGDLVSFDAEATFDSLLEISIHVPFVSRVVIRLPASQQATPGGSGPFGAAGVGSRGI